MEGPQQVELARSWEAPIKRLLKSFWKGFGQCKAPGRPGGVFWEVALGLLVLGFACTGALAPFPETQVLDKGLGCSPYKGTSTDGERDPVLYPWLC